MEHLADYIRWMGDYPISNTGLNDADALVLCALSYVDFSPVFPAGTRYCRVKDCRSMIEKGRVEVRTAAGSRGYPELLELAAASRRFGELRMTDYVEVQRQDPPLQFSALCFHDDRGFSFLAYRGTDDSLAGWEEDFMISFTRTEAQELALEYARAHVAPGRRWYVGGQSKGSNLALYACCLLEEEKWSAVKRLYLLDGPGFCPEVLDAGLIRRVDARATQIVPSFCVVGKLFAPQITDTKIVRSFYPGFLQHDMISWGIDHGGLALTGEHDRISLLANEAVNEWIAGIRQEDRAVFVKEIFDVLAAGGADTLKEIGRGGREGLEAILRRLLEASETTKRTLLRLPQYAVKVNLEKLKDRLNAELENLRRKQG